MDERRGAERYGELLLLLEGAEAARGILEGALEDADDYVTADEAQAALAALGSIRRLPSGGTVVGGRGRPLEARRAEAADKALQEFRAGALTVDYSGEERDDLDRIVGAQVVVELEDLADPGGELLQFSAAGVLSNYHAEWGIATLPGCGGVLARLDLEFRTPRRFSLRLIFDVALHQWALRALELTGRCTVNVRVGGEERRVRVRAPRSAQLTTALTVVRMLDLETTLFELV
ncbi:MAG TPA: hypothetical protein VKA89_00380 [Solirubrobacterales bacterium]|nr:hypothetical protein [Solirubrobacterales bacterium]